MGFIEGFLIVLVGLVAGFVGTNTGGGTLLTIPCLMLVGLPPLSAIATARLAAVGSMLSGMVRFHQGGKIDYKLGVLSMILSCSGSLIGIYFLFKLPAEHIRTLVGVVTILVLILMMIKRAGFEPNLKISLSRKWLGGVLFLVTGVVGGMVAGHSIFTTYVMILCFGKTFSEAAGTRKIGGLVGCFLSIAIFGFNGMINYSIGIPLFCGVLTGAYLGAGYGLKKGDRWIGRAFFGVVAISALRMLFFR